MTDFSERAGPRAPRVRLVSGLSRRQQTSYKPTPEGWHARDKGRQAEGFPGGGSFTQPIHKFPPSTATPWLLPSLAQWNEGVAAEQPRDSHLPPPDQSLARPLYGWGGMQRYRGSLAVNDGEGGKSCPSRLYSTGLTTTCPFLFMMIMSMRVTPYALTGPVTRTWRGRASS